MWAAAAALFCVSILAFLMAHTHATIRSHREVAHLFDDTAHPLVRRAGAVTATPSKAESQMCSSAPQQTHTELWGDVVRMFLKGALSCDFIILKSCSHDFGLVFIRW